MAHSRLDEQPTDYSHCPWISISPGRVILVAVWAGSRAGTVPPTPALSRCRAAFPTKYTNECVLRLLLLPRSALLRPHTRGTLRTALLSVGSVRQWEAAPKASASRIRKATRAPFRAVSSFSSRQIQSKRCRKEYKAQCCASGPAFFCVLCAHAKTIHFEISYHSTLSTREACRTSMRHHTHHTHAHTHNHTHTGPTHPHSTHTQRYT